MIAPFGAYPEDCLYWPRWPMTPLTMLAYQESADGETVTVRAWAVGTDCRRSMGEWTVETWMKQAYPEMWSEGLRRLAAGVRYELEQAGTWEPPQPDLWRENAVHCPHRGPAPAPAETA